MIHNDDFIHFCSPQQLQEDHNINQHLQMLCLGIQTKNFFVIKRSKYVLWNIKNISPSESGAQQSVNEYEIRSGTTEISTVQSRNFFYL